MTPALPRHLIDATTWSAMLGAWIDSDDPAVRTASTTWSGAELFARAAGAAELLQSFDSARGVPIPALLTSGPEALAHVIGGATSGHPLAPLGPRLTTRELSACIEGLPASPVLLAEEEFAPLAQEVAAATGRRVIVVGTPDRSQLPLDLRPDVSSTAFVLHTSGTSGVPKPVHYLQGRLADRVRMNATLCALGPGCVYATGSPFHHIAGLGNHTVALAAGATVVPLPRFTVDAWRGLAALGVTHGLTVPTMLELLLDEDALALPSLRVLQYGASPIHPATLRRTLAALPDVSLVNMFGQTEGSPITAITGDDHRRIVADGRYDLLASVGWPVPGVEVVIEDPDASGVGQVVARGSHFFRFDDDGWLRTGDMGRIGPDGELHLSGRKGDKIIRGGENVYPHEIEVVLTEHPGVAEAAVVGVADQRWGEIIRAVIVPSDPATPPDTEALRLHVRSQLAGFKVPTEWRFATELPRNAAGKVLRRLLVDQPDLNQ